MNQQIRKWGALVGPFLVDGAKIMLLMFLSLAMLIFLLHTSMALFHRYPLDYGEAPLVDQAVRLAAGQNIYRPDLSSPPYTISNYPPLYPLSMAPLVKLFGPNLGAGRVISLLSTLASAAFLALIVYTYAQDRLAAVITGLLFLSIPYVVGWSPLARVDMLGLALSTAGLYVVTRWPTTWRGVIVSALLLVAAIYTRQSHGLAAPLAAFVWLLTQDWRQALKLAGLVGGIGLILFLVLNLLTGGGFFYNIVKQLQYDSQLVFKQLIYDNVQFNGKLDNFQQHVIDDIEHCIFIIDLQQHVIDRQFLKHKQLYEQHSLFNIDYDIDYDIVCRYGLFDFVVRIADRSNRPGTLDR